MLSQGAGVTWLIRMAFVRGPHWQWSYKRSATAGYAEPMASHPDRNSARQPSEAAHHTRELRRSTPRRVVQRRRDDLGDSGAAAAMHGDAPAPENYAQPPREDRAG
jgi:hypothetical protein